MSIELALYLSSIFNNIDDIASIFFISGFIAFIIIGLISINIYINSNDDEEKNFFKNKLKIITIFIFVSMFFSIIIPDQKTMYAMIATNYLKDSKLPSLAEQLIEKKINDAINEKNK